MDAKYNAKKKKLIVTCIVIIVILAVMAGAWFFISSQKDANEKNLRRSQSEARRISSQIDQIEIKYNVAKDSITLYDELKQSMDDGKLSISDSKMAENLRLLNAKYRISNLNLEMDPIASAKQDPNLGNKIVKTSFTNIKLRFDALSDMHAISFIEELEASSDGYLEMTSFQINRERQISREVLKSFAKGEKPRVVSVIVDYLWFGIDPLETEQPSNENGG